MISLSTLNFAARGGKLRIYTLYNPPVGIGQIYDINSVMWNIIKVLFLTRKSRHKSYTGAIKNLFVWNTLL